MLPLLLYVPIHMMCQSTDNMEMMTQLQSEQHIAKELAARLGQQEDELKDTRHQVELLSQRLTLVGCLILLVLFDLVVYWLRHWTCGFNSPPFCCQVTTIGKVFTHLCLCSPSSILVPAKGQWRLVDWGGVIIIIK